MKLNRLSVVLCCAALCAGGPAAAPRGAAAQATAPNCCGPSFRIDGEIGHYKTPSGVAVSGGTHAGIFSEHIYGAAFTASVAGLPAGRYTVEVELAELFQRAAGLRRMSVVSGTTKLAENLDVFQAAGGFAKALVLTGVVEHGEDAVGGPLTIRFTASLDKAIFNAIRVKDKSGVVVASVIASDVVDLSEVNAAKIPDVKAAPIFRDPSKPRNARIDDLIRRLSLKEKVAQMVNDAPGVERLGLPAYNYWNEALHGVAWAGVATVYPQTIGMAAMWDPTLLREIADSIGTEARAKYNDAIRKGDHGIYKGLTFWTPNINIFRDPRWGRGQETYGEDPYLTATMGVSFIHGLQGDDPRYVKAMACAKHFAVHSGPEIGRHSFDSIVGPSDLYNTYLPQFEAAVREGHVGGVMGSYNRVNGEPANSNTFLLTNLLRATWGFEGYVVSDCGAINDIYAGHHVVANAEEASARAVKAGCNVECGDAYYSLVKAVNDGLLKESDLDHALHFVLGARFKLGMFDSDDRVPFSRIPLSEVDSPAHSALALRAAEESIVLLKNNGLLPLDPTGIKRIAVVGGNADSVAMLVGNYNGTPSHPVTILQGIRAAVGPGVTVGYASGGPLVPRIGDATLGPGSPAFEEAVRSAQTADVVVYVGGINADMEGEEGAGGGLVGFNGGDRTRIEQPAPQEALLKALQATGKPVVFVNCSGSAIAFPWAAKNLPAIVQAWYPGENGGTAVANVLFGKTNPAGRLPVTFYASSGDLPPLQSYAMTNRTYRYFGGTPLYSFGHGLSYTTFRYGPPRLHEKKARLGDTVHLSIDITNSGARDGDEVVQVYVRNPDANTAQPIHRLSAFQRVTIGAGKTKLVELAVPVRGLRWYDPAAKSYVIEPGNYEFQVGASSTDLRGTARVMVSGGRLP